MVVVVVVVVVVVAIEGADVVEELLAEIESFLAGVVGAVVVEVVVDGVN